MAGSDVLQDCILRRNPEEVCVVRVKRSANPKGKEKEKDPIEDDDALKLATKKVWESNVSNSTNMLTVPLIPNKRSGTLNLEVHLHLNLHLYSIPAESYMEIDDNDELGDNGKRTKMISNQES